MSFFTQLEKLCSNNGIKPAHIAQYLGLSSSVPTSWKNGITPNAENLVKIADYFGVSVDYLLEHKIKENQPVKNEQAYVYHPYGIDLTDITPTPKRSKAEIDILIDKLTDNQRALLWEYAYSMSDQCYEIKHWNEVRFNFISRYRELIDNSLFRYIMELFLHIKPQDYGDIMETLCRALEKKNYATSKYFIEVAHYFDNHEYPIAFTSTAMSDKFVEDYQDLIQEKCYNDITKLYQKLEEAARKSVLLYIIRYYNEKGIDIYPIVGYRFGDLK